MVLISKRKKGTKNIIKVDKIALRKKKSMYDDNDDK